MKNKNVEVQIAGAECINAQSGMRELSARKSIESLQVSVGKALRQDMHKMH